MVIEKDTRITLIKVQSVIADPWGSRLSGGIFLPDGMRHMCPARTKIGSA